jgi:hypothetical protein
MTPLRLRLHETCLVQYWPHGTPLPEGATVLADPMDGHHGVYSRLIQLSAPAEPPVVNHRAHAGGKRTIRRR